jgi:hypothetical protein
MVGTPADWAIIVDPILSPSACIGAAAGPIKVTFVNKLAQMDITQMTITYFMPQLQQRGWKSRIFTGVTPHGHHRIHFQALSDLTDQVDVGIIIVIGSSWNINHLVGHSDIFSIGSHVLWSRHNDKFDLQAIIKLTT